MPTREREAWLAVVQDDQGEEETELVTVEGGHLEPGAVIEMTNGVRITCVSPAAGVDEMEARSAA